jgi:hypothetical protein
MNTSQHSVTKVAKAFSLLVEYMENGQTFDSALDSVKNAFAKAQEPFSNEAVELVTHLFNVSRREVAEY